MNDGDGKKKEGKKMMDEWIKEGKRKEIKQRWVYKLMKEKTTKTKKERMCECFSLFCDSNRIRDSSVV